MRAADCIAINNGNWDAPATWNTCDGGVPGAGDTATTSNRTITLTAAEDVGALIVNGGILQGPFDFGVTDTLSFTSGTLTGPGTTTVSGVATFGTPGTSSFSMSTDGGRVLVLDGSGSFEGRSITLNLNPANNGGAGTLVNPFGQTLTDNLGFTTPSSAGLNITESGHADGNGLFTNAGTFVKAGNADLSTINVAFDNTGTIQVQQGTLRLDKSSTHTGAAIDVASGAALDFRGFTGVMHVLDGVGSTGAGTVRKSGSSTLRVDTASTFNTFEKSGGTTQLDADLSLTDMVQSSGDLRGAGDLGISGDLDFTGGNQSGPGMTTVSGVTTFGEPGVFSSSMGIDDGRTLVLAGGGSFEGRFVTLNLNPGNNGGAGTLVNPFGQTLTDNLGFTTPTSAGLNIIETGWLDGDGLFTNAGTFVKAGNATTSTVNVALQNTGSIEVQDGALLLDKSSTHTNASIDVAAGAALEFRGGSGVTHNLTNVTLTAPGTLRKSNSSTVTIDTGVTVGTVEHSGGTTVIGGGLDVGTLTQSSFGTLTVQGALDVANDLTLTGGTQIVTGGASVLGDLIVTGGTQTVTGATTVAGDLDFRGGTLGGAGTTTVQGVTTFGEPGVFSFSMGIDDGRTLVLAGGGNFEGRFGTLNLNPGNNGGAGTLVNPFGQTLTDNLGFTTPTSAGLNITESGFADGNGLLVNAGTFVKAGNATTSTVNVALQNTGSILVQDGALQLDKSSTHTGGSIDVAAGAALEFRGGSGVTHSLTNVTLTAPGTLRKSSSSTLTIDTGVAAGTVEHSGGTTVIAGGLDVGTLTQSSSGTLTVQGALDVANDLTLSGGTQIVTGGATILGNMLASGGTQTVTGDVTIAGDLDMTFGTIGGAGITTVAGVTTFGQVGSFSGSSGLDNGRTLVLDGGGSFEGRFITLNLNSANNGGAGTLVNPFGQTLADNTTFDTTPGSASLTLTESGFADGNGLLVNAGTFVKAGNATTSTVNVALQNTGSILVQDGALQLDKSSTHTNATIDVAAGAALEFRGGSGVTHVLDGVGSTGAGTIRKSGSSTLRVDTASTFGRFEKDGGTTQLDASLTLADMVHSGGNVTGAGDLLVTGDLNFRSGNQQGAGTTTVSGVTTFGAVGANSFSMGIDDGRTLVLDSGGSFEGRFVTLNLNPGNNGGAGTLVNPFGQTLADNTTLDTTPGSASLTMNESGFADGNGLFVNEGRFVKAGNSNMSTIAVEVNNTGAIDIQQGVLRLDRSSTHTNSDIDVASGAELDFRGFGGVTHVLDGVGTTGAGTVRKSGTSVLQVNTASTFGRLEHDGGNTELNAGLTVADMLQTGGNVVGAGDLLITGDLDFRSGNHSGPGTTTVQGITTFGRADTNSYSMRINEGRTMVLEGDGRFQGRFATLTLKDSGTDPGTLVVGAASTLTDETGFDNPASAGLRLTSSSGDPGAVVVEGILRKTGNATDSRTEFTTLLDNRGVVETTRQQLSFLGQVAQFSGSTLTGGIWRAIDTGDTAILRFQRTSGTDPFQPLQTLAADLTLSGSGSAMTVNGVAVETSLRTVADGGALRILDGRNFAAVNGLTNDGVIQLGGGTLNAPTLTNTATGEIFGFGTVTPNVGNSGTIRAAGGTLTTTSGITAASGTVIAENGATMAIGTDSSAEFLDLQGGTLALASHDFTVSGDYTNAAFGVGNAFDRRANVTGSGSIIGDGAAWEITGDVTAAGANSYTLDFGNVRGGTTATNSFAVANTGATVALRGALQTGASGANLDDARLTGTGVTAQNIGPIAAGDSTAFSLTFGTDFGGSLAGQSLAVVGNFDNLGTQSIALSGFATQLAEGRATPAGPVDLGNFRVGLDGPSQAFAVENLTTGAGAERLGIGSATATGNFAGAAAGGLINAGATLADAASVSVSGGAAGANLGQLTLQYITNGTEFDPTFTAQDVNADVIDLSATGFNMAVASVGPNPVVLGNQRIGGTASAALSIGNTATAGAFSEALNASVAGTTGNATTNNGNVALLAAGGSDATSIRVGVDTSVAGSRSGTVTLGLETDGAGTSGLGTLALADQSVQVQGDVFVIAVPDLPTAVDLGNFRRIDGASAALSIGNGTVAPAGFQEGLDASIGGTSGPAVASGGPIQNLGAGDTSTAISVGIDGGAAVAGVNSGSVTLNLASNGDGTSGLSTLALPDAVVDVTGTGFDIAVASVGPDPVVLGNQRIGGTASAALSIGNTAAAGAFSEALNASVAGTTGSATTNNGSVSLLAAGSTDMTSIRVGVDTSVAGARSGAVTLGLESDGTGTSGLSALELADQVVQVQGNVYALAAGSLTTTALNFGTVQVGELVSQTLSVSNIATGPLGFVEDLGVGFGAATGIGADRIVGSGSIAGLLAGQTNNTAMTVSVDTASAGAVSGLIAVNFTSTGTVDGVSNGLGAVSVGSADFGVAGLIEAGVTVIDRASPQIDTPLPIALGNVRVGDVVAPVAVSVTNAATGNDQAALNASIAGAGSVTAAGSFDLLAPGDTDATSLTVGMLTATAGAVNGNATISFVSDASNVGGCAPNCQLTILPRQVQVTGGVYATAQPDLPTAVDLGNFRLGDGASTAVSIANTNVAPVDFQEGLDAAIAATSGTATASGGPIENLAAGDASTAISVGIDGGTAVAGANNGTVTLNIGSNGDGTSGLATLALGDAVIDVSGTGYRVANPSLGTTEVVLAARVGDASPTSGIAITNVSPDTFTEALDVSVGVAPAGFTASGAISGLAAGASDTATLLAGLDTGTAGSFSGELDVAFTSSGVGTTGAADLSLGSGTVDLTGRVYQAAVAAVDTPAIDFGIVHVGDVISAQTVTVRNAASSAALNDTLAASLAGLPVSAFSGSGAVSGLGAGDSSDAMSVSLDTSAAGVFNASGDFITFASQNPDLADLVLPSGGLSLMAQVNNYANPIFDALVGDGILGGSGGLFTLDFGTVLVGDSLSARFAVVNDVFGPADVLSGGFDLGLGGDFLLSGFADFGGLDAGGAFGGLDVSLNALTAGTFMQSITLNAIGSNASGFSQIFAPIELRLTATVRPDVPPIPLPAPLWLLFGGLAALGGIRRCGSRADA